MSCDFLIIDTNNMISRSNSKWTKVKDQNYVFLSFLRSLRKCIEEFSPKKVIMAIDDYSGNSFRKQLLPQQKANRQKREKDEFYENFKKQKESLIQVPKKQKSEVAMTQLTSLQPMTIKRYLVAGMTIKQMNHVDSLEIHRTIGSSPNVSFYEMNIVF